MRRVFVLFCAIPLLAGCGEARSNPDRGALVQGLQVSPDASLTSATYEIKHRMGAVVRTGTVAVGDSPDVPVTVSDLPVDTEYELKVKGLASDGEIECEGEVEFDVPNAGATLTVIVRLVCDGGFGYLDLESTWNVCPVLDGLTASPLALRLGGISSMYCEAHDSDNAPTPLSYSWTANGVALTGQTAPTLGFSCNSLGPVTISASVSDGQCSDSANVEVSCE